MAEINCGDLPSTAFSKIAAVKNVKKIGPSDSFYRRGLSWGNLSWKVNVCIKGILF